MADNSPIQWTDSTWNPLAAFDRETGKRGWFCTRVSPGCKNCYAAVINRRLGNGHDYAVPNLKKIEWRLVNLDQPLKWKRPRRIFVNSMTDLFHEDVPDEMIAAVFNTMRAAPRHTFQVLTKRAERMASLARRLRFDSGAESDDNGRVWVADGDDARGYRLMGGNGCTGLPNVWLGVSVENQEYADERIPHLLRTPAIVRFVSYEPALGPVDFTGALGYRSALGILSLDPTAAGIRNLRDSGLHWIIVGGESGRSARPFDVAWAESIIEQCQTAGVACFVKQLGAVVRLPPEQWIGRNMRDIVEHPTGGMLGWRLKDSHGGDWSEWPANLRVREFPEVRPADVKRSPTAHVKSPQRISKGL